MAGRKKRVAVFCMQTPSHFNCLRQIVSAFVARQVETYVLTHRRFESLVAEDGGIFVDLFARHTVEDADAESIPSPCRSVTFAGLYGEEIRGEVERIAPDLILYDAFALVGYVVARSLAIPYVTVLAGHNLGPATHRQVVSTLPAGTVSSRCQEAVRRLREHYGLEDANPFSFAGTSSPFLNLYPEPPQFLTDEERTAFEPVAFFGSLPSRLLGEEANSRGSHRSSPVRLRVYVAFGAVVWKHFPTEALATLRVIAAVLGQRREVRTVMSLGGSMTAERADIRQPNVTVEEYVDQWRLLGDTDLFITHHGLNSTHEAIFQRVPMISCPFFGDQPGLAKRCQELGVAIPIATEVCEPPRCDAVKQALERFDGAARSLRDRLEIARGWELDVMECRGEVVGRLLALI